MRSLLCVCCILILVACKKKVYDKDHKLINVYEKNRDITIIYDYATNGALMMKLKFKKDEFIDTIYYYDLKNHFITIDSSKGKIFLWY